MRWDRSCSRKLRSERRDLRSDSSSETAKDADVSLHPATIGPAEAVPLPRFEGFALANEEVDCAALAPADIGLLQLDDMDDPQGAAKCADSTRGGAGSATAGGSAGANGGSTGTCKSDEDVAATCGRPVVIALLLLDTLNCNCDW